MFFLLLDFLPDYFFLSFLTLFCFLEICVNIQTLENILLLIPSLRNSLKARANIIVSKVLSVHIGKQCCCQKLMTGRLSVSLLDAYNSPFFTRDTNLATLWSYCHFRLRIQIIITKKSFWWVLFLHQETHLFLRFFFEAWVPEYFGIYARFLC